MLLAARHLALPLRKPAAPHIGRLCSRPYRLHSSSVGRTLCFAPIRPSRRDVEAVQRSNSKFPFVDEFKLFNGERYDSAKVIQGLDPLLTSSRRESITKVVDGRCFSVLPIVEGLHDMGNLGAVCRSADALGLGALHCINAESQRYRARKQRNSAGAEKWMDVRMWDTAASCINNAKASGYRVVATHFDPAAVSIHDVDWTEPTAILLGNEREGVSAAALQLADATAYIPMSGFVSSFNVSVAAALVFYEARRARLERQGYHCDLTDHDKQVLTAIMLLRHQGRTTENIQKLLERSQAESLSADSKLHRNDGRFL
ncbi:hypothetical protein ABBQ38_011719 [Trebouxia sp. C0009 RCD-2024]